MPIRNGSKCDQFGQTTNMYTHTKMYTYQAAFHKLTGSGLGGLARRRVSRLCIDKCICTVHKYIHTHIDTQTQNAVMMACEQRATGQCHSYLQTHIPQ